MAGGGALMVLMVLMVLHPPPREQRRTPSTAVTPPSSSATPPKHHRGSNAAHPRRQLPHPAAAQHRPNTTEGATQRTLDANYPTQHPQPATQPPPRVQSHAPSTPITPPAATPSTGNQHRGSSIAHPRMQLANLQPPQTEATATQGAPARTLNAVSPTDSHPRQRQPRPKEQHRAPSTPVTKPSTPNQQHNRRRGCNPMHPRPQSPRPQRPQAQAINTEGAVSRTLGCS